MNKFVIGLAGLIAGGAVGYFVGYSKGTKIANKELEDMDKYINERLRTPCVGLPTDKNVEESESNEIDISSKSSIDSEKLKKDSKKYYNYVARYSGKNVNLSDKNKDNIQESSTNTNNNIKEYPGIFQISEAEFAGSEYECDTLTYWADGILTDQDWNIIKDPAKYIGDFLRAFDSCECDSIVVRNERCKMDYEILLDAREWKKTAPKGIGSSEYDLDNEEK